MQYLNQRYTTRIRAVPIQRFRSVYLSQTQQPPLTSFWWSHMFLSNFLSGSVLLVFLTSPGTHGLPSDQCTSIGVGYLAMIDNSAIATHNDDCNECDIRVTHVPAMDWKKDSMRPVFATRPPYPR